jgi:hypothetical protein
MDRFEPGDRGRFDAVTLSHRGSGGKGSQPTIESLVSSLRSLPREEAAKFLNAYDYRVAAVAADLINERA